MTFREKIRVLESYLIEEPKNYKDSFKTDLYLFFDEDFSVDNPLLNFLNSIEDSTKIKNWVELVTSQIVLKFDEDVESIGDFIGEFIELDKV